MPETRELMIDSFGDDPVASSFYFVLNQQYILDSNFDLNCVRAAEDIWESGFPDSTNELKKITNVYFGKKISKANLEILLDCISKDKIPKGFLL